MALFAVLIPATILVVIGYFVLVASAKSDGAIRALGKYLSIWTFALAALVVVGTATAPMFGGRPFGIHGMSAGAGMREMMMHDRDMRGTMKKSEDGASPSVPPSPEATSPVPPGEPKQ